MTPALLSKVCGGRGSFSIAIVVLCLGLVRESAAQTTLVPPSLQASLLAKVAGYDRKFVERAGARAKVLLVQKADDSESVRAVVEMKNALAAIDTVGGLPHDEEVSDFKDAAAIANLCRSRRIAIVYFGPGLGKQVPSIRAALTSVSVLSVASVPEYVRDGIVLGFNLVSGNAKLVVHLGQARAQNVVFEAKVLRLMTVYGGENEH
jgi:hypothetical protein